MSTLKVEVSVFAHYDFYAALITAQQSDGGGADKQVEKILIHIITKEWGKL